VSGEAQREEGENQQALEENEDGKSECATFLRRWNNDIMIDGYWIVLDSASTRADRSQLRQVEWYSAGRAQRSVARCLRQSVDDALWPMWRARTLDVGWVASTVRPRDVQQERLQSAVAPGSFQRDDRPSSCLE
jgi:hypothetical protein